MNNTLVWFRQDLRTHDNTALTIAAQDPERQLYGLFISTPGQWHKHDLAPIRQSFMLQHVRALAASLQPLNIPLLCFEVNDFEDIPPLIHKLAKQHDFTDVYANHEYGWNEKQRDRAVHAVLDDLRCDFNLFHDQAMLAPGLTSGKGTPYTVYTPFKKRWLEAWRAQRPALHGQPARRGTAAPTIACMPLPGSPALSDPPIWPVGEHAALQALNTFCSDRITRYQADRDLPSVAGTSSLSPWLAAGVLSPRQCLHAALQANQGRLSGGLPGIDTWVSELIWRDFYIHVLDSFPQVSRHRAFKSSTETIAWRECPTDFQAWCTGTTGIPIVDAGMRQLVQTGWMHNRVRMITAMFLSKHLLIDWRLGERFFMQQLIDGHLASNNGGWQWAASTGTDAVPYFRIFNPATQSKRFDPEGNYIRTYVPELSAVSGKDIHLPSPLTRETQAPEYPAPIIDLKFGRERALAAFAAG
jgi:deoxyribodipyrimidine photo-lyase